MKAQSLSIVILSLVGIALHLATRAALPLYAVIVLGGVPLVSRILKKVWKREFGSDLLAGIAIAASVVMGHYLVGAILVLMLSGGGALEHFATRRAASVLDALAKRMPQKAHLSRADGFQDVGIDEVNVGDSLLVFPHELCPVDGMVVEGQGTMDESYLTGEPYELSKTPGSTVLSGAINGQAALKIVAQKRASDSRYAGIMRVMEDAELNRPRLRRLGDQLAAWYIPLTLGVALAAGIVSGESSRFLAVLVVATPCPLLIAIPVAVIGAISLAAGRGIIVKNPSVLERITRCRTVILDKTGTLTFGKPLLTEIITPEGRDPSRALRLAASLERYSRHPLAAAVLAEAQRRGMTLLPVAEVAEKPGVGLGGVIENLQVQIGGRKLISHSAKMPGVAPGLECVLAVDGTFEALLRFRDTPRPDSEAFLSHLPPTHGVKKVMLVSGDRESEVKYLAQLVGITNIAAEKSPEEKVEIVKAETRIAQTLFVGDGINDAPALAAATVGVAMGQNSDITSAAAGAVIMTASIGKLDELIHIGARMRAIALQSAIGGMALSLVGMAMAATGHLTPIQGAVVQEIIDLAAVLNAVRVAFLPGRLSDF